MKTVLLLLLQAGMAGAPGFQRISEAEVSAAPLPSRKAARLFLGGTFQAKKQQRAAVAQSLCAGRVSSAFPVTHWGAAGTR